MASPKTVLDVTRPGHRKFCKPPVKVACLSCRALRVRCDGQETCANCVAKGIPCSYLPSKRGGPRNCQNRKRKRLSTPPTTISDAKDDRDNMGETSSNLDEDGWLNQLLSLGAPGAGLRRIESSVTEMEQIFDSIFTQTIIPELAEPVPDLLQTYASDADILDAYYVFVHIYYPVLPPPERVPARNRPLYERSTFRPSSPLSLAISAILALIPHPNVKQPSRTEYVKLRRELAHSFAQSALEGVEADLELLDSSSDPSKALSDGVSQFRRQAFHNKVPICLEAVLALVLLSVYEYAQRGNINKMCNRAGQALTAAMSMSLHEMVDEDGFSESRRRAWWITYLTVCQGSIVSGRPPAINPYDPRFVTPYPEGWKLLIEAQQTILEATTFVHDLDLTTKSHFNASWISQRMMELDNQITCLLDPCRNTSCPSSNPLPPVALDSPDVVALHTLKQIAEIKLQSARIKTHRFCAFQDIPVFRKRHCDLDATAGPECCRLQVLEASNPPSPGSYFSSMLSESSTIEFPFSSHASSKICLHAALNIVSLLDNLPYPNPTNEIPLTRPPYLSRNARVEIPRMMPTFACCAMQSSYAMLMLCLKARAMHDTADDSLSNRPLSGFLDEVRQSLRLVSKALGNYSIAFEALNGMRDEITQSVEWAFSNDASSEGNIDPQISSELVESIKDLSSINDNARDVI
ncbi:C6 finger domain protein [Aspergillus heteromorphus CBS 117.55]|uniref:C6 finger domain protein n=1 Tax=Aspergillus heteromorphus CBS 117.55 TaxID=1448321 RepID=A0A317V0U5_9EURO|nr:C6 finger domain protein [Aspergillus heteromorphus CBS 117.55]PWY67893.1 C6 finger domain protein [Aspergillus heteromorphus CBS 117.55]